MKFSYAEAAEVTEQAIAMRESGMKWTVIRKNLGVSKTWLRKHIVDSEYIQKRVDRLRTSPELLVKAREFRAAGLRWKVIERQLGVNWLTLAHAIYKQNRIARELNQ